MDPERTSDGEDLIPRSFHVTGRQAEFLRWRAYHQRVPQAQTVREALDAAIEQAGWEPPQTE